MDDMDIVDTFMESSCMQNIVSYSFIIELKSYERKSSISTSTSQ